MAQAKPKLADILIQGGVLNQDQLSKALRMKEQNNCRLGEAAVKLGFTTEEAIALAVSKVLGVPYASRDNKILRPERGQGLEKILDEHYARENVLLPLFLDNSTLAVAMAEPDNVMVLDNLRLMTGYDIQAFIATKSQIIRV